MKELSIEQKAKAYDKAVKEAIIAYKDEDKHLKATLERIFPELGETEDERLRKDIIRVLKGEISFTSEKENEKYIAWLEKQGEPKYTKKDVDDAYLKGISDAKNEIEKQYEANYQIRKDIATFIFNYRGDLKDRAKWMDYLGIKISFVKEKQKPAKKIEPKFHEGDFIVNDYCMGKVIEVTNDAYLLDTGQGIPFSYEHKAHLWTIQDAKDGDVLICEEGYPFIYASNHIYSKYLTAYCGITNDGVFKNSDKTELWTNDNVAPATIEQRELLFQKMSEAGYEWDANKKELKKIERKSTWSEEDKHRVKDIIYFLDTAKKHYASTVELDACIDWCKSFKERIRV